MLCSLAHQWHSATTKYSCARLPPAWVGRTLHAECSCMSLVVVVVDDYFDAVMYQASAACVLCWTKLWLQGNAPHVLSARALVCLRATMDRTSPRLPQFLYSPFPRSNTTHHLFAGLTCTPNRPPFTAAAKSGECAYALLHRTAIARAHIRATAVACRIRRSYACRYLPTIARASRSQHPSDGRCTF